MEPFKFIETAPNEPPTQSRVWRLWHKVRQGIALSREDKNWLTEALQDSPFGRQGGILFRDWYFDFSNILYTYWVRCDSTIAEYLATDLKGLKSMLKSHGIIPQQIVKVGVGPVN